MPYGPHHRMENSRSQPRSIKQLQVSTLEVWGAPSRDIHQSDLPCVKAFKGPLPPNTDGLKFETVVAPTPGSGGRGEARGYYGTPGVTLKVDANGDDFAVIPIIVIRFYP